MTGLNFSDFPQQPDVPLLVAVSGGRDSVGLLARLYERRAELPQLIVGHVDHGMRPESGHDAKWVEDHAKVLGLRCLQYRLSLIPTGETQARELRYAALGEMASKVDAGAVLIAHHAADQLETRLFNLVRGTSPDGFVGMPACRVLRPGVLLIRPALECSPTYLHDEAPLWREDSTNAEGITARNKLRLEIIPQLQSLHARDVGEALESFCRQLKEDGKALEELVPQVKELSFEVFDTLPTALKRRWLRRFGKLESAQIERGLAAAARRERVDLGRGLSLVPRDGHFEIETLPSEPVIG